MTDLATLAVERAWHFLQEDVADRLREIVASCVAST